MRRSRPIHALALLALFLPLLAGMPRAGRAAEEVYFPETGQTLSDEHGFLSYWRAYGGLAQFGYPRTAEIREANPADGRIYTVQWFERNRFEWHPENTGTAYEVLLGLLVNTIVGDPGTPEAPVASTAVTLAVPPQYRNGSFAPTRTFTLPPGFAINLYAAGLPGARMLALAPNGDLFVSRKDAGEIVVLPDRNRDGTTDDAKVFASGLAKPHGLAFYNGYLYVAQEASVIRFPYAPGDLAARGGAETIVPVLPNGPGVGLAGDVNHDTRTIVFGPDKKMYVSVGSDCDLCVEQTDRRAAVLQFNPDGSDGRVFASGLRNAVGLRIDPRTGLLWATGNERNGLGPDNPPELFVPLRAGVNYGWPYCVGIPPKPDPTLGAGRENYCQTQVETALVGLHARTAPLGFAFTAGAKLPAPFANGAIITQHGPYGRVDAGHRLAFVSMVPGRLQTGSRDFALGWIQDGTLWGNPVDVLVGPDGALYVSDDLAGAIYRIAYTGP